jgi:hypothetical protein
MLSCQLYVSWKIVTVSRGKMRLSHTSTVLPVIASMSDIQYLIPAEALEELRQGTLFRWTLSRKSGNADKSLPDKIVGRLIESSEGAVYQTASSDGKREVHENRSAHETVEYIESLFGQHYRQINLHGTNADFELKAKSGGRVKLKTMKPSIKNYQASHDRSKNYLLPEDRPIPFLVEAGLISNEGKLKSSGRAKFRQINRYLEFLKDILPELPQDRPLQIIDFGCGKSYLTFALHHWLTQIENREAQIVGLDRELTVIEHCREVVHKLSLEDLSFEQGEIAGYSPTAPVDLVISLHACDTATDDALIQAVEWNAKVILAVPCCQHELFPQLKHESLQPLLTHGILKERFAAMATDSLRALALEACGYRTQLVEFIDMEHTPKNVMLRAVKSENTNTPAANEFEAFRKSLGEPILQIQKLCLSSSQD